MTEQSNQQTPSPSLSDAFNKTCIAAKRADHVIEITSAEFVYRFDFIMRQQVLWEMNCGYSSLMTSMPFSQLDRDVLITTRDKLVALGGHPPELPLEQPLPPARAAGLKL